MVRPTVHAARPAAWLLAAALSMGLLNARAAEMVTVDSFVRAETDTTFKRFATTGGFGQFFHIRQPTPLDQQSVIRMNRDTLYSAAVLDLKSAFDAYSFNNVGAQKAADGSITLRFGGDPKKPNFLPIGAGWNYTVRLYQPRRALLDGSWKFPPPHPAM